MNLLLNIRAKYCFLRANGIYYNYKGSPSLAEATITELTNPENYTKVTDK